MQAIYDNDCVDVDQENFIQYEFNMMVQCHLLVECSSVMSCKLMIIIEN